MPPRDRRQHIYFALIALLASFLGHICLVLILAWWSPRPLPVKDLTERSTLLDYIEVQNVETPPKADRQVVRQSQVPEAYKDDTSAPARFLSEETQRVLEETQALASGKTENRSLDANAQRPSRPNKPKKPLTLELEPLPRMGDLDLQAKKELKDHDESTPVKIPWLSGLNLEQGHSTLGDSLPEDVKYAEFTALNADRYLYYSFFARIEDLIRHRWVKYVRAVMYTAQNQNRQTFQNVWESRMEIVLDDKGNFIKALLYQGSGLPGLDQAPVQAFREAARIPNPPKEMVKADGTIRLQYQFRVRLAPQYWAQP